MWLYVCHYPQNAHELEPKDSKKSQNSGKELPGTEKYAYRVQIQLMMEVENFTAVSHDFYHCNHL